MDQNIYLDANKTKCVDYPKVNEINRDLTNKVIEKFKSEAFGDDVTECVKKIEKEIQERYKSLKMRLAKQYENQFKSILAPISAPVEQKIRLDQYQKPQDLLDDITKMKELYLAETKEMEYNRKELLLSHECERLITKGFENMWRKLRDESNFSKREVEERTNYLQQQLKDKKEDFKKMETDMTSKID